jgi:hypothetical protein
MEAGLDGRLRRIYAAVGELVEDDLSQFAPQRRGRPGTESILQDFRGGLTDEQLSNIAYSAMHNVANLWDHLRRWVGQHGRDSTRVDAVVRQSLELQVIIDLSNADKHGYPPWDGGWSGRAPRLKKLDRGLVIAPRQHGVPVELSFTNQGLLLPPEAVPGKVVVFGRVVDGNGTKIGEFQDLLERAIRVWESLLSELGTVEGGSA